MEHQDWTTTTIVNSRLQSAATKAAAAAGLKHSAITIQQAKVAASDVPIHVKMFTPEAVRQIQDYRRLHTLTQRQLDQRLSIPAGTIQALESRRAGPSARDLRVLGTLLKMGLTL